MAVTLALAWAFQLSAVNGADLLENGLVRAEFNDIGLTTIQDAVTGKAVRFARDGISAYLGDDSLESDFLAPTVEGTSATNRIYQYRSGAWTVRVIYELQPGWRFVSKQLAITGTGQRAFRVRRVEMFRGEVATPIASSQGVRSGTLLRVADTPGAEPSHGLYLLLQNPFLQLKRQDQRFALAYVPDLIWKPGDQAFVSDRLCLGVFTESGIRFPAGMEAEWRWVPPGAPARTAWLDTAEVDALVECARTFLLYHPQHSVRVHIGWCENDYQIDIGTPEGRTEYKRILDQAAAVGCQDVLFTPANNALAPLSENRDAWGWENILWFGLGQKIRKGEWDPDKDPLPASVQELLDYAKAKGLKPLAYVYPSLPFMQQPEWTSWIKGQPGGYLGADTGQRSFQDWLLGQLVDFSQRTGAAGYSFDHWWIAYDDTPSSKYQQWDGCRRILAELRHRLPDVVMDGRQQYHGFGVWTWLAGSYPHPLASDEQPESFRSFPDLHWDRGSADRQRRTAWWYRMEQLAPVEILPGYMTHQTGRNDGRETPRTRFRPADFDLLGWRYSVISAIGTAPFNLVANFLPARDEREFKAFSPADQKWLHEWLDWADQHLEVLRNLKPVLGPPQLGRVDGWAAFKGERGFVFLFNPNYRPLDAALALDRTIGLSGGGPFILRQLYPDGQKGRLLAPPGKAFWTQGDRVSLPMSGAEALVLEVGPAPVRVEQPILLGAVGQARLEGSKLTLAGVMGEPGTERSLSVVLPPGQRISVVAVNGTKAEFKQTGDLLTAGVRFAGAPFSKCQQVGPFDLAFTGGVFRTDATVPARVFRQLENRKRTWPVDYSETERQAAYLNSDRLLLFINVADPDDQNMKVALKIDGQPVSVTPAYTSIVRSNPRNTFVGWYADVSALAPGVKHIFEVELPTLAPGQFQGLFFDTVEAEYTSDIAR